MGPVKCFQLVRLMTLPIVMVASVVAGMSTLWQQCCNSSLFYLTYYLVVPCIIAEFRECIVQHGWGMYKLDLHPNLLQTVLALSVVVCGGAGGRGGGERGRGGPGEGGRLQDYDGALKLSPRRRGNLWKQRGLGRIVRVCVKPAVSIRCIGKHPDCAKPEPCTS